MARERRRITVGEIVRTAMSLSTADPEDLGANSVLLERVIDPAVRRAGETFLAISMRSRSNRCAKRPRRRMCSTTRRSAAISLPNGATFERVRRRSPLLLAKKSPHLDAVRREASRRARTKGAPQQNNASAVWDNTSRGDAVNYLAKNSRKRKNAAESRLAVFRFLRNRPPNCPDGGACCDYPLKRGFGRSALSSGSVATSRAASRHNSAGVRRRPSSSKMRTLFRLRPISTRTCSRAALALA